MSRTEASYLEKSVFSSCVWSVIPMMKCSFHQCLSLGKFKITLNKKHRREKDSTSTTVDTKIQKHRANESNWEDYSHDEKTQLTVSLGRQHF